jgi:hypothetical protein
LEKERLHYFLLSVDPEYRRQFENSNNNNYHRNLNFNQIPDYFPPSMRSNINSSTPWGSENSDNSENFFLKRKFFGQLYR